MIDTLFKSFKCNSLQGCDFTSTVALSLDISLWARAFQQIKQCFNGVCQGIDTTESQSQNQRKNIKGSFLDRGESFFVGEK